MLDDCLQSIVLGNWGEEPVIVMFDDCDENFINYFMSKYGNLNIIVNRNKAFGFGKNANLGMRLAHQKLNQDVFVVNMDTVLPSKEYMDRVRNGGLATPCQVDISPITDVVEAVKQLNNLNRYQEIRHDDQIKFAGFCMYWSKELMDKIGYLDDGFIASFEDDDACVRAKLAGFPVSACPVQVHHYSLENRQEISTTGAYDQVRMDLAKIRFRLKYQIPVHIEDHGQFNAWILENHKWKDRMRIS